jgi:hypothetical protein
MIKRRGVLLGGIGAVALLAAGAIGAELIDEAEIAASVRRGLSFLNLDEDGPRAFAKDKVAELLAKRPSWLRIKSRIRTMLAKPTVHWGFSDDKRTSKQRKEDSLATLYLLSSDFFRNGADTSRVVRYVALYDPVRACGSPFARPPTDQQPPG